MKLDEESPKKGSDAPMSRESGRRSNDRVALFAPLMLVTFGGAAFGGTMKLLPSVNSAW